MVANSTVRRMLADVEALADRFQPSKESVVYGENEAEWRAEAARLAAEGRLAPFYICAPTPCATVEEWLERHASKFGEAGNGQ
ncbi:MAG: hypothetical protein IT539_13810 [Bradyrhizobiaceae bacterium]|nr:hypothetical protein [Bradyrhizobiaceae bacterium]